MIELRWLVKNNYPKEQEPESEWDVPDITLQFRDYEEGTDPDADGLKWHDVPMVEVTE